MMKRLFLMLIISIAFLSTPAQSAYNNNISADPFSLINWGRLNVTYEHKIDKLNSFTVFFESYDTKYHDNWTGYAIGASYRWYISPFKDRKTSLEGFSFGPLLKLAFWESDYYKKEKLYKDGATLALGGEAAYKWVWGGFSLEPKITLILNAYAHDGRDGNRPLDLNINIGYAW